MRVTHLESMPIVTSFLSGLSGNPFERQNSCKVVSLAAGRRICRCGAVALDYLYNKQWGSKDNHLPKAVDTHFKRTVLRFGACVVRFGGMFWRKDDAQHHRRLRSYMQLKERVAPTSCAATRLSAEWPRPPKRTCDHAPRSELYTSSRQTIH